MTDAPPFSGGVPIASNRGQGQCKTPGCSSQKSVETEEVCADCFNKGARQKCRSPDCLNKADVGFEGLCKVCTEVNLQLESGPPLLDKSSNGGSFSGFSPTNDRFGERDVNSLAVKTFKSGFQKCILPECQLTGNPNTGGVCQNCYDRMNKRRAALNRRAELMIKHGLKQRELHAPKNAPPSERSHSSGQPARKHIVQKDLCATAGCYNVHMRDRELCRRCTGKKKQPVPQPMQASLWQSEGHRLDSDSSGRPVGYDKEGYRPPQRHQTGHDPILRVKMVSASSLRNIEDKYFECSYGLELFKEPKLLPCVHRFCRNCLKEVIGKLVKHFNCPLCDYLCDVPSDGVDGFRTDFHMKSLLEYIQLRQSAKTEEAKECAGCAKEAKVTSYCFKCKGFLCEQCYQIHMTLRMMREHKPSVLSLRDMRDQKLTFEKLASLTESPRCNVHIDRAAEVCCATCSNLPICVVCGHHGRHKGHELHDVNILAEQEREKIERSLETIEKYTVNVHQLPIKVEGAKGKLSENISDRKEKLQIQYIKETEKIGRQLQEIDGLLEMNKAEIDEVERQEVMELEKEREKEIDEMVKIINDKYDKVINEKKAENRNLRADQDGLHGGRRAKVNRKLGFIDKEFEDLDKSIDMQGDQNSEEIGEISKDADNRKIRFENFRSSVSSILASKNDWTHAQCIPDINAASNHLIEYVGREYPELKSLTYINVSDLPSFTADTVSMAEQAESVINIDGIEDFKGHRIHHMATTDAGSIIITGDVDDEHTHITVINRGGKVVRQYKEKNVVTFGENEQYRFRSCSAMSVFKAATTCRDSEVGIYDCRNGTYIRRSMSVITSSWKSGAAVTCVATDRNEKNIFVSSNSRNVFILDDELNYCRTLRLPKMIKYSTDISTHDGNLLVCDSNNRRACIVTTEGHAAELVCELPKPDHEGGDWKPFRVCTDSNGFIYILWYANILGQVRKVLTQHSQEGRKLLITKPVAVGAFAITTTIAGDLEELTLATVSGKMYTYGLATN